MGCTLRSPRAASVVALLVLQLGVAAPDATAQYPPTSPEVGAEVRVDTDAAGIASSAQPQIARTDDDVLHVVWQDYRGPQWAVYYRRLSAFGSSASAPEVLLSAFNNFPDLPLNAIAPRIATDGASALFVVWHGSVFGSERIYFARSLNGGLNWSPAQILRDSTTQQGIVSEFAGPPELCADTSGHVYVTWSQSDGVRDQIYYAVSDDWGATWSVPGINASVNLVTSGHSEHPRVAADGSGHVYVAYLDHRSEPYRDVYLRRSDDWGQSWVPGEQKLNGSGVEVELELVAYDYMDPITDDVQSRVLAAWIDVQQDSFGTPFGVVRARASRDAGATFGPYQDSLNGAPYAGRKAPGGGGGSAGGSVVLPPPPGGGGGGGGPSPGGPGPGLGAGGPGLADASGPAWGTPLAVILDLDLAVDGAGRVHAAYSRIDYPYLDQSTDVHLNVFEPESSTWRGAAVLSRGGATYPSKGIPSLARAQLAAAGDTVFVAWMHSAGGFEDYGEVVASWSTDGGRSWQRPTLVTHKAAGPGTSRSAFIQLVARGDRAALVWDDRRAFTDHSVLPLPPGSPLGAPDVYLNVITLP